MDELKARDRLKEYARTSKKICYSNKIFEKSEENKKPKIVLRDSIKETEDKEKHVWTVVLKYSIDDVDQEVIMGILNNTTNQRESAVKIVEFICQQLEENYKPDSKYENYEQLCQYVKSGNIPFEFTMEGMDILAKKDMDNILITRTYSENTQGRLECLYPKEEIEKMKNEHSNELIEYIKEKQKMQRWKERRQKILDKFETDEKKQEFLKGEMVTEFVKEIDEDMLKKQSIVSDYLLEAFDEEKGESNPKLNLARGYYTIKEKGIAIDIKRILENIEKGYFKHIKEKNGKVSLDEYKNIEKIEDYKNFFDLVKNGQDWNARLFALKLKKIDFNSLKLLVKTDNCKDDEMLHYLDLKEKMVNELQTDSIEVDYNKYKSAKEMCYFLLHSGIREKTKDDDEHIIDGVYELVRKEIIINNENDIKTYNHYAEKSNIFVCELPNERKLTDKDSISSVARKITEELKQEDGKNKEDDEERE